MGGGASSDSFCNRQDSREGHGVLRAKLRNALSLTIEFHVGVVVDWPALSARRATEVIVRRRFWESGEQAVRFDATPVRNNRFACFLPTGKPYPERVPYS